MIVLEEFAFSYRQTRTRFPFRYGIASMTELPHVFLWVRLAVDGGRGEGLASEGLAPKWFTKNPETTFGEDLREMVRVLRAAADHALEIPPQADVFRWWRELYEAQSGWAQAEGVPPLLANLGTSLVERAVLDAFCRIRGVSFAQAWESGALGFRIGAIHGEIPESALEDFRRLGPAPGLTVRHTVGLGDPLTAADVQEENAVADGLPLALEDVIPRYGLTRFKIKLSGDVKQDVERLNVLAQLLPRLSPDYQVTLDGNEQFGDIATFRQAWDTLRAEPGLRELLGADRVLLVEQPLHRDWALGEDVEDALRAWPDRPPLIIDESDAELSSVRRALQLGYAGSSHKNCKGVFKGLANGLFLHGRRDSGARQTGEDLANLGPVALLQDMAVMAVLRVTCVERNGHHYFKGLSPFPRALGEAVMAACPDLYEPLPDGTASLRIHGGRVNAGSVLRAPFGQPLPPGELLALAGVVEGLPGGGASSSITS